MIKFQSLLNFECNVCGDKVQTIATLSVSMAVGQGVFLLDPNLPSGWKFEEHRTRLDPFNKKYCNPPFIFCAGCHPSEYKETLQETT